MVYQLIRTKQLHLLHSRGPHKKDQGDCWSDFIKPHLDMPNSGNVAPVIKKDRWHQPVDKYQGNHYCIVHWTEAEIYPVGSAIHPLNNWDLKSQNVLFCTPPPPPKNNQRALPLTHTNLQLPNHFCHKRTVDKSTLYFGIGDTL